MAPATCGAAADRSAPARRRIDGEGYTVDRSKPAKYAVDERVFHQKFGMGTVTKVDGDKLEVEFDHAGHKNVVDTFVSKP